MSQCLVTGASGLLGKHLVDILLENGHHVTLLLRNPEHTSKKTLIEKWIKKATTVRNHGRNSDINVWNGDITKKNLGVDDGLALTDFNHIYHLAAVYNLNADKDATLSTNVNGTEHLLEKMDDDKFRGVFHFAGSVSIAGDFKGEFSERMFSEGQQHGHVYNRSKYLAEKIVREKHTSQNNYDIRIYRPSHIVGHSKTGEMDKIDGPYYGFAAISAMKKKLPPWFPIVMPKTKVLMDMVPVDYVAEAMYTLSMMEKSELPDDLFCFHLTDPNAPTLTEASEMMLNAAGGPKVQFTFSTRMVNAYLGLIKQAANLKGVEMVKDGLLSSLNVPLGVLDAMLLNVRFGAGETTQLLRKKGVDLLPFESYVETLWDYYNRHLDPDKTKEERSDAAFRGKIVLITGGSEGIGFASAKRCVSYGAKVIIAARNQNKLDKARFKLEPIAKENGGSVEAVTCNVSDLEECDNLVAYILNQYGYVDILFSNAGLSIRRSISKAIDRFHDYQRTMQTNFFGPLKIVLGLLPSMAERRNGHILYSSTMNTMAPTPWFSAYAASKSALDAIGDSLAGEYADKNIHFTSLKFPLIKTGMLAPTKDYDDIPLASPEFAAQMFVDAVLNKLRKNMTGLGVAMGIAGLFTPKVLTQVYNYIYRVWPDEEGDYPEMKLDRAIVKKIIPHTPV
jgi:NAD(P)-dependent dehydrogenase (short-subunit alcohol dehydrogenase family)